MYNVLEHFFFWVAFHFSFSSLLKEPYSEIKSSCYSWTQCKEDFSFCSIVSVCLEFGRLKVSERANRFRWPKECRNWTVLIKPSDMFMMEVKASLTYRKTYLCRAVPEFSFVFIDFYLLLSIFQIMEAWEEERHLFDRCHYTICYMPRM